MTYLTRSLFSLASLLAVQAVSYGADIEKPLSATREGNRLYLPLVTSVKVDTVGAHPMALYDQHKAKTKKFIPLDQSVYDAINAFLNEASVKIKFPVKGPLVAESIFICGEQYTGEQLKKLTGRELAYQHVPSMEDDTFLVRTYGGQDTVEERRINDALFYSGPVQIKIASV